MIGTLEGGIRLTRSLVEHESADKKAVNAALTLSPRRARDVNDAVAHLAINLVK